MRAWVSPVHAHRCKNLCPQQFVGTVNTHSMATQIQYSAKAEGAILKKRGVLQYAECVGWAIGSTHHLNGCLGAAQVAYTKIPRRFFSLSIFKSNFQRRNRVMMSNIYIQISATIGSTQHTQSQFEFPYSDPVMSEGRNVSKDTSFQSGCFHSDRQQHFR